MVVPLADGITGATTLPRSTASFSITCLEIEVNSHLLKKIAQSNAALELSPAGNTNLKPLKDVNRDGNQGTGYCSSRLWQVRAFR